MKKIFNKKNALRYLGSILLLFLVFRTVNSYEIISTLKNINGWVYLASFLIYLGNRVVATYRWKLLLEVQEINIPFWSLYNVVLYGSVFNSILPSSFGGDAARIFWLLKDQSNKKAASVVATIADKVLGLSALVILALAIVPFNPLVSAQIRTLGFILLVMFTIFMTSLIWGHSEWIVRILHKLMFTDWLKQNLDEVLTVLKTYKNAKTTLFAALFVSFILQSVTIINQYLRFEVINVDVSMLYLFLAIPITTLVVIIPLSIGGIGLRELTLINLLGYIGIESHQVVSYAIIGYSNVLVLSIGLVIYNLAANPVRNFLRRQFVSSEDQNSNDI